MDLIPVPVDYHVLCCVSLEPSRFNASKNPETPNYFSYNPTSRPSPCRFACEKKHRRSRHYKTIHNTAYWWVFSLFNLFWMLSAVVEYLRCLVMKYPLCNFASVSSRA